MFAAKWQTGLTGLAGFLATMGLSISRPIIAEDARVVLYVPFEGSGDAYVGEFIYPDIFHSKGRKLPT